MFLPRPLFKNWGQTILRHGYTQSVICSSGSRWKRQSYTTCMDQRHRQHASTILKGTTDQCSWLYPGRSTEQLLSRWNSTNGGVTWLWEVNDLIRGYYEATKHGTRTGFLEYTLNSVQPLEKEHFEKALEHFIRIVPSMRSVIRTRGDEVWCCQHHDPKIDFEVLPDEESFRDDCFKLIDKGFQDSDLLPWRARLMQRASDAPCLEEGVKIKYPYQYNFMLTISHALTDGIDAQVISNSFFKILNSVVGDLPICDNKVGVFENNNDVEVLLANRKEKLLQEKDRLELIKSTLQKPGEVPAVIRAFPHPTVSKPSTEYLQHMIDPQMLRGLRSKCSQNGVTFNSFLIAIANLAITELMREAIMMKDSCRVSSLIFMDSRRYRKTKTHLLGCYTLPLIYNSEVKQNTRNFFWDYCKRVNNELHSIYTKDGLALDQAVVQQMIDSELPPYNYTDNLRPVSQDYSSVYLGDMDRAFPGVGEYVQITGFKAFQNFHNYRNAFVQEIVTFRGRTQYNFTYVTNYFTKETANAIADRVFHLFEVVGK